LGLSQAAAAQSLGVSRGLVADAERGRRAGQQTLIRLIGGLRRVRAECEEAERKKAESA
jgi:transcriptional regulator with XRE-family HTH domain